MLSLYKLHIFVLVAEEGNMSAAAERLFMAQASVSQHIKELENSLGVRLFSRGRRGVKLTNDGQKLYERAQEILRLAALAESEITDVRNLAEGKLTICGTPGLTTFFFPDWLQEFRRDFAQVEVTLNTGTTPEITHWVRRRTCDLGFTEGEPEKIPSITATPLEEVPQLVVIGHRHPWWNRSSINLAELNSQQMITRQPSSQSRIWLDNVFETHQIGVEIVAVFDAIEPIKRSVSMSDRCFTILPEYAVQTEVKARQLRALPIEGRQLSRQLWLLQYSDMPLTPFARAFLETLTTRFPTLRHLVK